MRSAKTSEIFHILHCVGFTASLLDIITRSGLPGNRPIYSNEGKVYSCVGPGPTLQCNGNPLAVLKAIKYVLVRW